MVLQNNQSNEGVQSRLVSRARDERGASIIIALVFFLICGIIGSVVLTAASVNAKSVQTHKELQQAEFNVSSAAQTIGYDMDMVELAVTSGENGAADGVTVTSDYSQFGKAFWENYGSTIMQNRKNGNPTSFPDKLEIQVPGYENLKPVSGEVTVDVDLNITIKLSLDKDLKEASPYNMEVTLQCVPTYDHKGKLVSFTYERAAVQKAGGAA